MRPPYGQSTDTSTDTATDYGHMAYVVSIVRHPLRSIYGHEYGLTHSTTGSARDAPPVVSPVGAAGAVMLDPLPAVWPPTSNPRLRSRFEARGLSGQLSKSHPPTPGVSP